METVQFWPLRKYKVDNNRAVATCDKVNIKLVADALTRKKMIGYSRKIF